MASAVGIFAPAFAQDSHAELDSASINANEIDRLRIESGVTRYNTEEGSVIPASTPTLGENSAYTLIETNTPSDNSITLYDIKNQTQSIQYVDQNGQVKNYEYTTKSLDVKYYNLNFTSNVTLDENGSTNNRKTNINDISTGIEHFVNSSIDGTLAYGAAVSFPPDSAIENIQGDFINNTINHTSYPTRGGAIYNQKGSLITNISGDFINNSVISFGQSATAGAIKNEFGTIDNITGNFIANKSIANSNFAAQGGAILTNGSINEITGAFINNYCKTLGQSSSANGGAIAVAGGSVGSINADFIGNYAKNEGNSSKSYAAGGAIAIWGSTIGEIKGNFIGNYAISNAAQVIGGAIDTNNVLKITGSFIDNYARTNSENFLAQGGALITKENVQINADGSDANTALSLFSGNYTQDYRGKINNAIFMRQNLFIESIYDENHLVIDGIYESIIETLNLEAKNKGIIIFNDTIDGGEVYNQYFVDKEAGVSKIVGQTLTRDYQYNLHLTGDDSSNIILNNEVRNANISLDNVNVTVKNAKDLNFAKGDGINSLTMNSGNLNFLNMGSQALNLQSLNLNGGTLNIANSDVDLQSGSMGRITSNEYGNNNNTTINVQNLTVSKDMKNGVNDVELPFADKSFANNVNYTGSKDLYSKILKYHTWYNPTNGSFNVRRIGGVGGYNPAVLTSSVAAQTGAYVAQTAAFNQAFNHADGFMNNPTQMRYALSHPNNYAINTNNLLYSNNETTDKSMWVQPYASFESISLKNGPKVDTTSYGTLVGGNGELKHLNNGWSTITTAYAGYNGSSQSYSGINVYQNGGMLGATQTWYKGNFYTALTANVGASVGEANTPYGHDNFTMLMAGVASKTGYNLEYKEGKYIIQPSMLVGYSFINTFDYTSAAGVKISQDPLNSLQLRPNVKFISNLKNGWQPYASVGVVWNILNDTKASAEDVTLPEMSIKPYVEYGVGVQKQWKDKFTGYAQAMLRNGGRNGISLTAGFKWTLGKEVKPIEKVEGVNKTKTGCHAELDTGFINANEMDRLRVEHGVTQGCHPELDSGSLTVRKVVKQLTPAQRTALINQQNTTRTTASAILKQL